MPVRMIPAWLLPSRVARARLSSRRRPTNMAWAATPEFIVYRSGWWTRSLSIARHGKLQVISLEQSPFDRRHRMGLMLTDIMSDMMFETGNHHMFGTYSKADDVSEPSRIHERS